MGIKILSNLDMNQNETQRNVIHKSSTAPLNPIEGQEYYNTEDKEMYYYNGTEWVSAASMGGMSTKTTSIDCTLPNDL